MQCTMPIDDVVCRLSLQVKMALEGMHDRCMFNLSYRHITLSTVGVVSKMKRYGTEQITLYLVAN